MPHLESMAVTPKLFRQSPLLFDALLGAAKRCQKSRDSSMALLLASWRKAHQEGKKKTPLLMLDATGSDATSPEASPAASATSALSGPARMLRPSRPAKELPSLKLGSLFATMREKRAAEEAAAMETAKDLMVELGRCSDGSMLRSLVPRLQSLAVTARLLRQSPSIFEALSGAAKRFRKSKDKTVSKLLSNWDEMRKQQQQPAMLPSAEKAMTNTLGMQVKTPSPLKRKLTETPAPPTASPTQPQASRASSLGAPAKQSKITAFLGGVALKTTGA